MAKDPILQELQEIKKLLSLQKQILTLDEFCIYTGISKNQAYHLTSTGKIKFYRPFGKIIFFDLDEVIQDLKQNPVLGISEQGNKVNKYLNRQS